MTMRIRKKPEKPNKKDYRGRSHYETIHSGCDSIDPAVLQEYIDDKLKHDGVTDCYLELSLDDNHCYYESDTPSPIIELIWHTTADYEYELALRDYQSKLNSYKRWYSKNKLAIEAELKRRNDRSKSTK